MPGLTESTILHLKLGLFLKRFKISAKIPEVPKFKKYLLEQYHASDFPRLTFSFLKKNFLDFIRNSSNQKLISLIEKKFMRSGKKARLFSMILRRAKTVAKVTKPNGNELSPSSKKYISQHLSLDISTTPIKMVAPGEGVNAFGERFNPQMQANNSMMLSFGRSPPKRLAFIKGRQEAQYGVNPLIPKKMIELLHSDELVPHIEKFEFSVTQDVVQKRLNLPRVRTQQQVMEGKRAIIALREMGLPIDESEDGRSYHWAHRHGHGLGGAQAKENLDPMTAASNYQTLIKVEKPIFDLLNEFETVFVRGMVVFHDKVYENENKKVPIQVLYCISTDLENTNNIYVCIDPLSHQLPSHDEALVASQFILNQLQHLHQKQEFAEGNRLSLN